MTARKDDLSGLPDWPLLMSGQQAAAYFSLSETAFRQNVAPLITAIRIKGAKRYDRRDLDLYIDTLKVEHVADWTDEIPE